MDRDELIQKIRKLAYPKLSSDSFDPLVYRLHGTRAMGHKDDERNAYAVIGPDNAVHLLVIANDQAARVALGHAVNQIQEKFEVIFIFATTEFLEELLEVVSNAGPITGINFEIDGG